VSNSRDEGYTGYFHPLTTAIHS